jgi:hypothetical protein
VGPSLQRLIGRLSRVDSLNGAGSTEHAASDDARAPEDADVIRPLAAALCG